MGTRGARRPRVTPQRRGVRPLGAGIPARDAPEDAPGAHARRAQDARPALDDRPCAGARAGAPARQRIGHPQHPSVPVDEGHPDRRTQERRVDGRAAVDPERLLAPQVGGPEEPDEAAERRVGEVAPRGQRASVGGQGERRRVEA
jgi:hypothetical protein